MCFNVSLKSSNIKRVSPDVGPEEGEHRENCLCLAVLCTIIMVHKDTGSSYRSVDCVGL